MTTHQTFEVLPRDLGAYRAGNTGVPCVHRFHGGRPRPHLLVNALATAGPAVHLVMPARVAIVGRDGVHLARRLAA